jgi:hypothetical protein
MSARLQTAHSEPARLPTAYEEHGGLYYMYDYDKFVLGTIRRYMKYRENVQDDAVQDRLAHLGAIADSLEEHINKSVVAGEDAVLLPRFDYRTYVPLIEPYEGLADDMVTLEHLYSREPAALIRYIDHHDRGSEYPDGGIKDAKHNIGLLEGSITKATTVAWTHSDEVVPPFRYQDRPPTPTQPGPAYVPYPDAHNDAAQMTTLHKLKAHWELQLSKGHQYAASGLHGVVEQIRELRRNIEHRTHAWMLGGHAGYAHHNSIMRYKRGFGELHAADARVLRDMTKAHERETKRIRDKATFYGS